MKSVNFEGTLPEKLLITYRLLFFIFTNTITENGGEDDLR